MKLTKYQLACGDIERNKNTEITVSNVVSYRVRDTLNLSTRYLRTLTEAREYAASLRKFHNKNKGA